MTGTNQASPNLLTNAISHGQTSMYMMIPVIEMSKKAVRYSFKIFDPGKERIAITLGLRRKKGKNEFVSNDRKRHLQDDDAEGSVVACTLEADLLQNTNGNDEVIIIDDIRRIQKKVRTKIVPVPREISISSAIVQ